MDAREVLSDQRKMYNMDWHNQMVRRERHQEYEYAVGQSWKAYLTQRKGLQEMSWTPPWSSMIYDCANFWDQLHVPLMESSFSTTKPGELFKNWRCVWKLRRLTSHKVIRTKTSQSKQCDWNPYQVWQDSDPKAVGQICEQSCNKWMVCFLCELKLGTWWLESGGFSVPTNTVEVV